MEKTSDNDPINKLNRETERYTFNYRLVKSLLMITAWIAYGLTMEIVGPTFEDLKITLNLSYKQLTFALVLRASGYIVFAFVSGLVLDRVTKYADIVMALASVFRCLRELVLIDRIIIHVSVLFI